MFYLVAAVTLLFVSKVVAIKLAQSYDYVVIGSGIGGLSCAGMLNYYGYSVCVLESHDVAGGVAHAFEKDGFKFDAGPSLWNGMSTKPYNPLREVLELVGEGDTIKYAQYDGWVMHVTILIHLI
jgi:predicted NAD/FAD-dependent oxidoreductase